MTPYKKAAEVIGLVFRRLTVIDFHSKDKGGRSRFLCQCECGNKVVVQLSSLKGNITKSCGCWKKEINAIVNISHGESHRSPEYNVWSAMIQRCTNPKSRSFVHYGGRGITVCERWRDSYENFLSDMGRRPSTEFSIEREDLDKGYELANCKWIPKGDQNKNKRNSRYFEYNGEKMILADWARRFEISHSCIQVRARTHTFAEVAEHYIKRKEKRMIEQLNNK